MKRKDASTPDEAGATLIRHLAEEAAFEGIGYATAGRLWRRFGEELYRLLGDGDVETLAGEIGQERAMTLVAAWRERLAEGDVVIWLDEHRLDRRLARKIVTLWGAEAIQRLRGNPYMLLAVAEWTAVDAAALRIGTARDAPERLVAAAEAALYARYQDGHTWMARNNLIYAAAKLLYGSLNTGEKAIALAEEQGAILRVADGFQPMGACMMERYVAKTIAAMAGATTTISDADIGAWLQGGARQQPLDPEQQDAVKLGLQRGFGLIVGGAGVGKTTVLRTLCEACGHFGVTIYLMALAGRAAARMREATGHSSSTIAAFLKRLDREEVELTGNELVVIDEASMVDLPTMYRILRHLPDGSRVMLVGDARQLPPIGFGLVLHALISMTAIPQIELLRIYRQKEATGIPAVSREVREGRLPDLPETVGNGVSFISKPDAVEADDIVDIVAELGGFDQNVRILSPLKAGPAGVEAINARFHDIMAAGTRTEFGFAVGEPIMFLRNDYRRDLRNGSLGVVTGLTAVALIAEFDGVEHEFRCDNIGDITLAYAITVHKAQGSQFRRVIIPVTPSRLLDRSLIYTAITRATDCAVLIGSRLALQKAVDNEQAADRRQVAFTDHF